MSKKEQSATKKSALEEKRLIPITKSDEKYEEHKSSDHIGLSKDFSKDYYLIYQKIRWLFENIDSKTASETAISVNKYLVYQLIWSLKYLVELAIIENDTEWLKRNLPSLKQGINNIKINITVADPNLQLKLQEGVDKLFIETENLLKKENQDIVLRWSENIISLGGSAIRDIGEMSWRREAKQRLKEKSGYISDHNTAALLKAESYQQYLRETAFNKKNIPLIIAHNCLMRLQYIQKRLNKDPTNESLLAEQKELLKEKKKHDEKESQTKKILGDTDYNKLIEKRKIRLEKMQIRNELSILAQEYLQASNSLFLEDSEPSNKILLAIDSLQKSLSQALDKDEVFLPYQALMKQLNSIRDEIQYLKSLSEKLPFGKCEFKLPTGAMPTPLVTASMIGQLEKADFKISTIKAVRENFFVFCQSLKNSYLPSKN